MNLNSFKPDIAIIGHIAKDIIEVDGKIAESLGGGVYYGALAGNQMGLDIAIVTRLKKSDFPILEQLERKNIKVYVTPSDETTGIHNIYSSQNMEFRSYIPLGFAGAFNKSDIPEIFPRYLVIGAIVAGEIEIELFEFLASKFDPICIDIQGFIRFRSETNLYYKDLDDKTKNIILSRTDFLKLDQTELEVMTGLKVIEEGAQELMSYGLKEILVTHEGGISLLTKNKFITYPWRNKSSIGRTGRGDTAFISYLGSRLEKSPEKALKFSAALTSLKMESLGGFSLSKASVIDFLNENYAKES